jgi:hypothetical protein
MAINSRCVFLADKRSRYLASYLRSLEDYTSVIKQPISKQAVCAHNSCLRQYFVAWSKTIQWMRFERVLKDDATLDSMTMEMQK